jgi:hypothetical protein
MIILLCTIANVCLLGGSIQAFRATRKQAVAAYDWMTEAHRVNLSAIKASTKAEEHAAKAEEQASNASKHASIADQHAQTVGQISLLMKSEPNIRLVDTIQPNISNTGGNIGKRR